VLRERGEQLREELRGEGDEVEIRDLGSQVYIYPSETGFAAISAIHPHQEVSVRPTGQSGIWSFTPGVKDSL
jgi:hypothetical protein